MQCVYYKLMVCMNFFFVLLASTDLIGCPMDAADFVVGGTCSENLFGMCEALWRPDLVSK